MPPLAGLAGRWGTLNLKVVRESIATWDLSMRHCKGDWLGYPDGHKGPSGLGLGLEMG